MTKKKTAKAKKLLSPKEAREKLTAFIRDAELKWRSLKSIGEFTRRNDLNFGPGVTELHVLYSLEALGVLIFERYHNPPRVIWRTDESARITLEQRLPRRPSDDETVEDLLFWPQSKMRDQALLNFFVRGGPDHRRTFEDIRAFVQQHNLHIGDRYPDAINFFSELEEMRLGIAEVNKYRGWVQLNSAPWFKPEA